MPDTENTPGSASTPLETYQMSLRRAKREAAEARKANEALARLRRTFPLWWQMFELKDREVSYQSFQKWREKASELLDSVQEDIISGNVTRLEKGYNDIKTLYYNLDDVRRSIKEDIEEGKKNINSKEKEINKIENRIENFREEKYEKRQELVSRVNAQAGIAAVIGFFGGCSMGLVEGDAFVSGIMGLLVGGAIVWFLAFKLIVKRGTEPLKRNIKSMESEKKEKEIEVEKTKKEVEDLKSQHKTVLTVSNVDNNKKIKRAENTS